MSLPLNVEPSPQMSTPSSCMARTSMVPVTARPSGGVVKYAPPPERMTPAPQPTAAQRADVEGGARHGGQALLDQLGAAVDGAGDLGAVEHGAVGDTADVGLVV